MRSQTRRTGTSQIQTCFDSCGEKRSLNEESVLGLVGEGMLDRFGARIDELESVVREIAIDITTGTFVEKLPPQKVWEKTGNRITMVNELTKELREYLFMLKPENVPSIEQQVTGIYERLNSFQETFKTGATAIGGSQLSIEELRKALVEVSEFISLCRAVKAEPSEIISEILQLREGKKTEVFTINEAKIQRLGYLVKEAQSSYKEAAETIKRLEGYIVSLRSEYENLVVSLYKKGDEKA